MFIVDKMDKAPALQIKWTVSLVYVESQMHQEYQ